MLSMKYLLKISLFFSVLITYNCQANAKPQDCNQLKTSCEYYLCLESQKNCGEDGYLKAFGHSYCYKYKNVLTHKFSKKGQKWLTDVRECLISELANFESNISCSQIKKQAFASHTPCYKKTNFCDLRKRDKLQLIKSLQEDIVNPQILKAGIRVLKSCKIF
jgi:hypothetical protein